MKKEILLLVCIAFSLGGNVIAASSAINERLRTMKMRESTVSLNDIDSQYLNIFQDANTDEDKGAVLDLYNRSRRIVGRLRHYYAASCQPPHTLRNRTRKMRRYFSRRLLRYHLRA